MPVLKNNLPKLCRHKAKDKGYPSEAVRFAWSQGGHNGRGLATSDGMQRTKDRVMHPSIYDENPSVPSRRSFWINPMSDPSAAIAAVISSAFRKWISRLMMPSCTST